MMFFVSILIHSSAAVFYINEVNDKWFPCKIPMELEAKVKWTGLPLNFTEYHLAPRRGLGEVVSGDFNAEFTFTKEKELYWFGRKQVVSTIRNCDSRYSCMEMASSYLERSFVVDSSLDYSFEEWMKIVKPNPPHPILTNHAVLLHGANIAEPLGTSGSRYMWAVPVMWRVKGTLTVKRRVGISTRTKSVAVDIKFPMKRDRNIVAAYGTGQAGFFLGE